MKEERVYCPALEAEVIKSERCPDITCDTCDWGVSKETTEDRENYSTDVNYWDKRKKYKGRPGAWWEQNILAQAYDIIHNKTLKEWKKKFGISPSEYYTLRSLLIENRLKEGTVTLGPPTYFPQGYAPEAVRKMNIELNVLELALGLFLIEIEKAKGRRKTVISNIVRHVFGEHAETYINMEKGKGDNVHCESISRANKSFLEWIKGKKNAKLPHTFYDKEKLKGLCVLAFSIHLLLRGPYIHTIERLRVILKIKLLVEKHAIKPEEIFGLKGLMAISGKTNNLLSMWEENLAPEETTSVTDWIQESFKRRKEIDEILETLKDI